MKFTKMHGTGNDYIFVESFKKKISNPEELARRMSDRHFGVGADGLVLIGHHNHADFSMEMYNADGSKGRMCGNAIRCVGKYVYDIGLTEKTELTVKTLSGIKTLKLHVENEYVNAVTVDMGEPLFSPADIPCLFEGEKVVDFEYNTGGFDIKLTCVSMGNPHAVLFVDSLENAPVIELGGLIEKSDIFPEGVNVEFVRLRDSETLDMRVWERGSGETLACGTGACAAAVASCLCGHTGRTAAVHCLGGVLSINWDAGGHVFMTGNAVKVFDGEFAE